MNTSSRIFSRSLLALACLAMTACDGAPADGDGGVPPAMDGSTPSDDGGGGDTDAGEGGDADGGGGGGGDCATEASAWCARFMECDPIGFLAAYEDDAICRRVVEARCEDPTEIPLTNGVADPAACDAAQLADCEGFFASRFAPVLPACVPLPGEVTTTEGACFTDAQCGTRDVSGAERRMYCRPLSSGGTYVYGTAECPRGSCIVAKAEGASCNPLNQGTTEFCDRIAGQACLLAFDADAGTTGDYLCRSVQYGTTGDACFPGSDRDCASGYECDPEAKTCMAALDVGQACIPDRNLCDHRRGLQCLDQGSGNVCVAPRYVGVGAQCGTVTVDGRTEMRLCSAYARCEVQLTTPVCVALRTLDETCTLDPDNCEPGLECDPTSNTCRVPEPSTTCP